MSSPLSANVPSDDTKERVRDATDIADVVGSYIALRRNGRNLVGLCPWHDDSRPSLQVNPERQTFRCWVCAVGGDVFNFVMRMERIEFREALEHLADRAGITLARGRGALGTDDKAAMWRTLGWAAERFRDCLRSSPAAARARQYLTERGLATATIDRFGIGFAPEAWDWLVTQAAAAGIPAAELSRTGLAVERQERTGHYDRFRGRVIFPIRDPLGRCVAFGGRVLPGAAADSAKYINSPETALFSKSSMLYGLDTAKDTMSRSRRAVVVEGYTDCLAARQAGIDDVVAVLGTALGARHVKLLRRFADRIVLVLDGDDAGRRRANEILDVILAEPIDIRIARLPAGVDPCEFLLAHGPQAFESLVEAAGDPLEYRMEEVLTALPADAGDDAALAAIESVLKALATASAASPLSPSQRRLREDQVVGRLSRRFGLSRDVLRDRIRDLRRSTAAPLAVDGATPTEMPRLPAWDREVIEVLVGVPDAVGLIVRQVGVAGVDSGAGRAVLAAAERLHAAGRRVALSGLLLEITDPSIQSLLVAVDEERAARKHVADDVRLHHLEDALRRRSAERSAHASHRALKTSRLDSQAETELLERLVAERRAVQGMTEPKDG